MTSDIANPLGKQAGGTHAGDDSLTHIVGDVGGTHAVFARASRDGRTVGPSTVLMGEAFASFGDALRKFIAQSPGPKPTAGAFAVAGPITHGKGELTNRKWLLDITALERDFAMDRVVLLNDFSALAYSVPTLGDERRPLGGGTPMDGAPIGLIGPGTGLGVSGLIAIERGWQALETEGGHASMAVRTAREAEIFEVLRKRFGHVSLERVLSGPGLVNLYSALTVLSSGREGPDAEVLEPETITRAGLTGTDPRAVEVLTLFCGLLGTAAGNLALTLGARGGIYIGGGIAPKIADFLVGSMFRASFEDKGRFADYMAAIPVWIITAAHPALSGAALRLADAIMRGV